MFWFRRPAGADPAVGWEHLWGRLPGPPPPVAVLFSFVLILLLAGCAGLPEVRQVERWVVETVDRPSLDRTGERQEVVLDAVELGDLPRPCRFTGWDIPLSDFIDDALECGPEISMIAPGASRLLGMVSLDVEVDLRGPSAFGW